MGLGEGAVDLGAFESSSGSESESRGFIGRFEVVKSRECKQGDGEEYGQRSPTVMRILNGRWLDGDGGKKDGEVDEGGVRDGEKEGEEEVLDEERKNGHGVLEDRQG